MTKLSKCLLLIIVLAAFLFADFHLTGVLHSIFKGVMIGWASCFIVNSIEDIVNDICDNA